MKRHAVTARADGVSSGPSSRLGTRAVSDRLALSCAPALEPVVDSDLVFGKSESKGADSAGSSVQRCALCPLRPIEGHLTSDAGGREPAARELRRREGRSRAVWVLLVVPSFKLLPQLQVETKIGKAVLMMELPRRHATSLKRAAGSKPKLTSAVARGRARASCPCRLHHRNRGLVQPSCAPSLARALFKLPPFGRTTPDWLLRRSDSMGLSASARPPSYPASLVVLLKVGDLGSVCTLRKY